MDEIDFLEPFSRLLTDIATPAHVRAVEAGEAADTMWAAIEESGFLDALVAEECGGAGLSLAATSPLLQALGHHAVPVPVAETMAARALLARGGIAPPSGPIVLATFVADRSGPVPLASLARHVLAERGGALTLAPIEVFRRTPTGVPHDGAATLEWIAPPASGPVAVPGSAGLRPVAAVLRAAAIAGAGNRLLHMTSDYANERVQFGKPISKQQVIQQQLAFMAEQVVAARIAAEIGCSGDLPPTLDAAAVAKVTSSAAAAQIANIAHSVHGAIGISEEHNLQLFTRRLHEWRLADGSEAYWSVRLGRSRLAYSAWPSVDFMRGLGTSSVGFNLRLGPPWFGA